MKYNFKKPFLIVIHGPMGSGKTTLADTLHDEITNLAHFGIDHIKWLVSDGKTNPERMTTHRRMIQKMADEYLTLGTHVLVEQAFIKEDIATLKKIAEKHSAKFLVYTIEADKEILNQRIEERTERLNKPSVTQDHIDTSYDVYKENVYSESIHFDSEQMSTQEMANAILEDLKVCT